MSYGCHSRGSDFGRLDDERRAVGKTISLLESTATENLDRWDEACVRFTIPRKYQAPCAQAGPSDPGVPARRNVGSASNGEPQLI